MNTEPDVIRASAGGPGRAAGAGPGLLAGYVACLLLPMVLAAALPLLPGLARIYLIKLPLVLLVGEAALVFALLLLPLFGSPAGSPGLSGAAAGGLLGAVALPFLVAARTTSPAGLGYVVLLALLVACTAGGVAAAAAAWGTRGAALAVALSCLPALLAHPARDVYPPLAVLARLCPLEAAAGLASTSGGGWAGFLPGLVLLISAVALGRKRPSEAATPGDRPEES
jgi:hypothetical protein